MLLADAVCTTCAKPTSYCVCAALPSLRVRPEVLVLQHPQEQDELLGTVPLLRGSLAAARVRVGLSWPSLATAWGAAGPRPGRWAVAFPGALPAEALATDPAAPAHLWDRRGRPLAAGDIDGLVLLDGSWRQAKALWWRNAWLLKLARLSLQPQQPSIYGRLRREPSRQHLSTLEAAAQALVALGEPAALQTALHRSLRRLTQQVRDGQASQKGRPCLPLAGEAANSA